MINRLTFKTGLHRHAPALVGWMNHFRMKPSFFIVGFQKCGTTTLYDALMSHPHVNPGLRKENDLLALKQDRLLEFELSFPFKKSGQITGDASHLHTWMPWGIQRIKENYPEARILVIMRNPVDRAYSHFKMDQRIGYLPEGMTFERWVNVELEMRNGLQLESNAEEQYAQLKMYGNKYGYPLSRGLYYLYLDQIRESGLTFMPLFLEDFIAHPDEAFKNVLDFIGLSSFDYGLAPSNQGRYETQIGEDVKERLNEFYALPNQKLKEMLGLEKLPWD